MFENPVVGEIDSLCREFIRKGRIDKTIQLLSKFSEMQDLTARKFPVNNNLHQAYIRGDDESVKWLFKKREDFMREYYNKNILPCFKPYLTMPG